MIDFYKFWLILLEFEKENYDCKSRRIHDHSNMGSLYRKPTIWKRYKRAKNRNFSLNTQNINYQRIERRKKTIPDKEKELERTRSSFQSMPLPQLNPDDYNMDKKELENVFNNKCNMEGGGGGVGDNHLRLQVSNQEGHDHPSSPFTNHSFDLLLLLID